ncbi:putative DNA base hypermodification protein [Myroides ceti]|uniref:DNA base hypermodification protein n=1 Tax=Paenimyroides ceti TaxID=395087 RepID=A0ABT8CP52_9FLAO|nr:nucleotide kinase domain-containing protein [Paenimyroides ceti]MDN3706293.1 putative DNA base hypermodification protein [Paenimyroides ceti]
MEIIKKLSKPKKSIVFDTYWKFAAKRQDIFFNKINHITPLTSDPILERHRFTNVYRASDRVSQYLIRNVIYRDGVSFTKNDLLFRILLFKIFNKISTWKYLESEIKTITVENFDSKLYSTLLSEAKKAREVIYSGAYIMTSGKSIFGYDFKHENHIELLKQYVQSGKLLRRIENAKSMEEVYKILLNVPTFGSFLAYQYTIDINYSTLTNFSEMDFVKAGPGAKDGIKKCFIDRGDFSDEDVIKFMCDIQESQFEALDLDFKDLWGRKLQLIDCQNLFCEVDKYSRAIHPEISGISNRTRIKQIYKPEKNKIDYLFPPKWKLNVPL